MLQAMKGNRVLMCGPLAQDPEFVTLGAKQIPAVKFSVIAERGNRDKGEAATYCHCTAWRRTSEALKGSQKGDPVLVLGTVEEREWNGKIIKDYTAEFVTPGIKEAIAVLAKSSIPEGFPAGTTEEEDAELPF